MDYFTNKELACKCGCGQLHFDHDFRKKLNEIRHLYGKPMTITSGYRCKDHPVEAKKPIPGTHNLGCAVDIACTDSRERFEIIKLAIQSGITRIGLAKGFVHIDFANKIKPKNFPENVMWDY